jgi:hypothetical protein
MMYDEAAEHPCKRFSEESQQLHQASLMLLLPLLPACFNPVLPSLFSRRQSNIAWCLLPPPRLPAACCLFRILKHTMQEFVNAWRKLRD